MKSSSEASPKSWKAAASSSISVFEENLRIGAIVFPDSSGGEQLLDEPSLGLAPRIVEEIFDTLRRVNADEGTTMQLVEQNAARALDIAHYGYVMENGRVVLEGRT